MPCPHFTNCPLRIFEKEGRLSDCWKNEFCTTDTNWKNCVRYQEAIQNIPHPDHQMPDGTFDESLK
ncbi:uracil-DNA glycosylase [Patescibacteria group bacterium]|nr:uracil-DNA glycosylase [Patescibacteria group bacterium]